MICAYCASRIPDGSVRCPSCGAALPAPASVEAIESKPAQASAPDTGSPGGGGSDVVAVRRRFRRSLLKILAISAVCGGIGALGGASRDEVPILTALILVGWSFLGLPIAIVRAVVKYGPRPGQGLLVGLLLALATFPLGFLLSFIGAVAGDGGN
ncbi:hypothetical protein [Roseobacter sp. HKCCA0434]|uniref:hypothetical protein n=1 Tax=Roseobacter sp. HKCCA0434 TaxID=3079297 RepID=UPI0029059F99|nr:hypothetical protein [Roseobacter sp. HKCCA0434]